MGLWVRNSELNIGTTQSARSSISTVQPALRGSSRSQSLGQPSPSSNVQQAKASTSNGARKLRRAEVAVEIEEIWVAEG